MSDDRMPDPLPESWLPEPAIDAEDEADREARVRRIMASAEPRLRELARRGPMADPSTAPAGAGWLDLGRWWRPAAVLAAAAALVLLLTRPAPPEVAPPAGSAALGAVVTEGEPASLWEAAGSEAHPVLALIALDEATLEEESP